MRVLLLLSGSGLSVYHSSPGVNHDSSRLLASSPGTRNRGPSTPRTAGQLLRMPGLCSAPASRSGPLLGFLLHHSQGPPILNHPQGSVRQPVERDSSDTPDDDPRM